MSKKGNKIGQKIIHDIETWANDKNFSFSNEVSNYIMSQLFKIEKLDIEYQKLNEKYTEEQKLDQSLKIISHTEDLQSLITDTLTLNKIYDSSHELREKLNSYNQKANLLLLKYTCEVEKSRYKINRSDLLQRSGRLIEMIEESNDVSIEAKKILMELDLFLISFNPSIITYDDRNWILDHKLLIDEYIQSNDVKSAPKAQTGFFLSERAQDALKKDLKFVDISIFEKMINVDLTDKCIVQRISRMDLVYIFSWLEFNDELKLSSQTIPSFLEKHFLIQQNNGKIYPLAMSSLDRYQSKFNGEIINSGILDIKAVRDMSAKFPSVFSIKK